MLTREKLSETLKTLGELLETMKSCTSEAESQGNKQMLGIYADQLNRLQQDLSESLDFIQQQEMNHQMDQYGQAELLYNNVAR
ncbi:MAG: hypothetical protein ACM3PP_09970 [Candidatus Saccharibacteria bacterium]